MIQAYIGKPALVITGYNHTIFSFIYIYDANFRVANNYLINGGNLFLIKVITNNYISGPTLHFK